MIVVVALSRFHTSERAARNESTKRGFVSETNLNRTTECAEFRRFPSECTEGLGAH